MAEFCGFKGENFQFDGKPNKFFNLISDSFLQVNARFNANNLVDLIGIQVGENCRINYIEIFDKVKVNDIIVNSKTCFPMKENDRFGSVEINDSIIVDVVKYTLNIKKLNQCLQFTATLLNHNLRPHGIIGQTADFNKSPRLPYGKQAQGIIEGKIDDYEVSNIWADNFKYNKFMKSKFYAVL